MNNVPERLLSTEEVLSRVPFSRTTLWRMAKDGRFPRPVSIPGSRAKGYPERLVQKVITEWIEADAQAHEQSAA